MNTLNLLSLSFLVGTFMLTVYFMIINKRVNELKLLKINANEKMTPSEHFEFNTKKEKIDSIIFWLKVSLLLPALFLIGYLGL